MRAIEREGGRGGREGRERDNERELRSAYSCFLKSLVNQKCRIMHTNPKCVLHFIQIVQNDFTMTKICDKKIINTHTHTHKKHKELKSVVVYDLNDSVFSNTGSQRCSFYSGFGCSVKWTCTIL